MKDQHSFLWAERLLKKIVDPYLVDGIFGDVLERYHQLHKHRGRLWASWFLFWGILGFLRYLRLFRKQDNNHSNSISPDMLKNYLKTIFRSFAKRKAYVFLNIIGLTVGMASFILIWQYVQFEKSFDQFHENVAHTYRVIRTDLGNGRQMANTKPDLMEDLPAVLPEMETGTRFFRRNNASLVIQKDNDQEVFKSLEIFYADSNFLSVFTFPSRLNINQGEVLKEVNTAVITESLAERLLGKVEVIGEKIEVKDPNFPLTSYTIVDVLEDIPDHSHFNFDILLAHHTPLRNGSSLRDLNWNGFYSYFVADANAEKEALESKLRSHSSSYFKDGENMVLGIQPMEDIHLKSDINFEIGKNNDIRTVNYLTMTAFLILIMAYFNYINFSTAKSTDRAKEIGVRKVLGAQKRELRLQFFLETAVINVISLFVALGIIFFLSRYLSGNSSFQVLKNVSVFQSGSWIYLAMVFIGGILLSGFYPALVLSSFNPIKILRGNFSNIGKGLKMRSVLVSVQYTISIFLIIASFVIFNQINYMIQKDKGVNIQDVLIVNLPDIKGEGFMDKLIVFGDKLASMPFVESVSTSSTTPGSGYNYSVQARTIRQRAEDAGTYYIDGADENFVNHYQVQMLSGRNFRQIPQGKGTKVIINEAASTQLGFDKTDDAVGQQLLLEGSSFEIIGVIANYNHRSLKESYDPQILKYYGTYVPHFSIRLFQSTKTESNEYLTRLEKEYSEIFNQPFDYYFLEQEFNKQYESDINLLKLSGIFSFIGILIAVFGLTGMIAFTIARRLKEVAIRKVLGASGLGIMVLLSRQVIVLNLIAGLFATVLSIFYLNQWLEDFAFKIGLSPIHFLAPIILVLVITVLIIMAQSSKVLALNLSRFMKE